jgi:hypothetical protein
MALDANLVVDRLADNFVLQLGADFAPHRSFAVSALPEGIPVGRNTLQIEVSNAGSTVQTNPSTYITGAGTNQNAAISVNEYSVTWQITSEEGLQGHRFASGPGKNANQLADKVWAVVSALMVTGTFSNADSSVAEASFADSHRQFLWASITGSSELHLVLSRLAMSGMLPSDKNSFQLSESGAYGFAGLHTVSNWSAASSNVYGFAAAPQAFAVVHGVPARPDAVVNAMQSAGRVETLDIPGGMAVEFSVWADPNTRILYASLALCYGAAVTDDNALTLQLSA